MTLRTPKHHHHIGSRAGVWVAFYGIPKQVSGDEDIWVVAEKSPQPVKKVDDVLRLQGVVRHRLPTAFGIDDLHLLGDWRAHRFSPTPMRVWQNASTLSPSKVAPVATWATVTGTESCVQMLKAPSEI